MNIGHIVEAPQLEIAAGTGPALLVALSVASARPRNELRPDLKRALEDVGDTAGETWLNLFGVSLDAGPPFTDERLLDAATNADPVDLRRHLLGRHAWTWCTLVGAETIEAAAEGNASAFSTLLDHPRYYAGRARESLAALLPLSPDETRRRLARALEVGRECLAEATLDERVYSAAGAAAAIAASTDPMETIERVTSGYRYVPEPEAERVLLIPHAEPSPWLVLAQHRGSRLVVYSVAYAFGEERLTAVSRALADPKRVEILGLLGRGIARITQLVEATGLTRSTVHHHLSVLREARLIDLEGNARAYRYHPRGTAAAELAQLLERVLEGGRP